MWGLKLKLREVVLQPPVQGPGLPGDGQAGAGRGGDGGAGDRGAIGDVGGLSHCVSVSSEDTRNRPAEGR